MVVTAPGEIEVEPQPYVDDRPPFETARLNVTHVRAWAGETVPACVHDDENQASHVMSGEGVVELDSDSTLVSAGRGALIPIATQGVSGARVVQSDHGLADPRRDRVIEGRLVEDGRPARIVLRDGSRLLGLPIAQGHESVRVGVAASLTVFRVSPETLDLEVQETIVAGRSVYTASSK
jgi:hypothetical protein